MFSVNGLIKRRAAWIAAVLICALAASHAQMTVSRVKLSESGTLEVLRERILQQGMPPFAALGGVKLSLMKIQ
jgi:hypothetical protein